MGVISHMTHSPVFLTTIQTRETTHIKPYVLRSKNFLQVFAYTEQFKGVFLPFLHTPLKHVQSVFLNLVGGVT